ncbi:MAG: efflux RND transporter periplasmic adaptor subunit [Polaromonas sp.]
MTSLPLVFQRHRFAFAVIAACAALTGAAAVFSPSSQAADAVKTPPKPALTVSTTQPTASALPVTLAANGSVVAWQEAIIGAEATGLRLLEVRANVGDVVRRGQLLARFSPAAPQAEVAQAQANVLEAEATAAEAAANADRARSLQSTGALSASQINQYVTLEKTAQAKVAALRSALNSQQLRLGFAQVLAPDDGVISARTATVGAVVGNGAELFRLIRQGRLEWRAEVTSNELGRITVGMPARITLPGGQTTTGKVRMVAPTVDVQTRTGLVYVDLPKTAAAAKAGMFAKGEFEFGSSNALTVPQQAVVVRDGFSYVFQLGADQRVAQRKVQVGRRVGESIEVMGVAPEAVLVASGAGFLNDGDLVKVAPAASATKTDPNPAPAKAIIAPAAIK